MNKIDNLSTIAETGQGVEYVRVVMLAYAKDHPMNNIFDVNTQIPTGVCQNILMDLGAFDDTIIYKVAIVRKLDWISIHMGVMNTLVEMKVGRSLTELREIGNHCMSKGSVKWANLDELKSAIYKLHEEERFPVNNGAFY